MKGAKLLTDTDGNDIKETSEKDVLEAFGNHVVDCFGLADGKVSYLC